MLHRSGQPTSPETLVVVEAASVVKRREGTGHRKKRSDDGACGGALLACGDFLRRDPRQNDEQKALGNGYRSPAVKSFGLKVPNSSTSEKTHAPACIPR